MAVPFTVLPGRKNALLVHVVLAKFRPNLATLHTYRPLLIGTTIPYSHIIFCHL